MLGIDVGKRSLKVVHLEAGRIAGIQETLSPCWAHSEDDDDVIADALHRTVEEMRCGKKAAWGCIGGSSVITHLATYPEMDDAELENAVRLEVEQFFFQDWETMDFDYQILERLEDGGSRVMFVGAPKKFNDRNIKLFKAAELYPAGMTVKSLAITKAFLSAIERTGREQTPRNAVLVDLGSSNTSIVLLNDNQIEAMRDVPFGGKNITKSLMEEFQTDFAEAEKLKYNPGDMKARVTERIEKTIKPISKQIQMTIGYDHRRQSDGDMRMFLTGEGCRTPGLPEAMEKWMKFPAQLCNPFEGLEADCAVPGDETIQAGFAVALGCALIGESQETEHDK